MTQNTGKAVIELPSGNYICRVINGLREMIYNNEWILVTEFIDKHASQEDLVFLSEYAINKVNNQDES